MTTASVVILSLLCTASVNASALTLCVLVQWAAFCNDSPKDAAKTQQDEQKERDRELVKSRIKVVKDKELLKTDKDKVLEAIGVLKLAAREGWCKECEEEAIPALVEILDFLVIEKRASIQKTYPTSRALVAMGKPVVPVLVKALGDKDRTAEYKEIGLRTLYDLTGGSRKKAKELLKQEIAKEKAKDRAMRLQELEKTIKLEDER